MTRPKPKMPREKDIQCRMLARALERGEKLTALGTVMKYGVLALSQRIQELEKEYHWRIRRKWLQLPGSKKRVMEYFL